MKKIKFIQYLDHKLSGVIFIAIFIALLVFHQFDIAILWFVINLTIQLILPYIKSNKMKKRNIIDLDWLHKQAPGTVLKIKDKKSGVDLGEMKVEHVLFLANEFDKNGMDSNAFYFDEMTFELFKNQYKQQKELLLIIQEILNVKNEVEIFWNK